jgi:hypothetical protein
MATWKKVALEGDLGVAATGETAAPGGSGEILISASGSTATWYDMANNALVAGNSTSGAAVVTPLAASDVKVTAVTSSTIDMSIEDDRVTTAMLKANVVTKDKMAHYAGGGLLVYHDGSTVTNTDSTATYAPVVLPAGTNGQVLKTVVSGDVEYLTWGSAGSVAALDITSGDAVDPGSGSLAANFPILFSDGQGDDKTVYGDVGDIKFQYSPPEHLLEVGSITCAGTGVGVVTAVSGVFSSGVNKANTVQTAATSSASCFVGLFDSTTGYQACLTDSNLTYNASTDTLSVQNLVVEGNNTTVNTNTLEVQDKTIVLASASTLATASNADGSGIVVDVNQLAQTTDVGGNSSGNDAFCPRLYWSNDGSGAADTSPGEASVVNNVSSIGWRLADVGTLVSDVPTEASQGYNIAPTLIEQTVVPSAQEIGIGAMWLTHNTTTGEGVPTGALYIQVA